MSKVNPADTVSRLDGENIYLRPLDLSDVTDTYVGWLNDPAVKRFLETRHSDQDFEAVRSFVERVNERPDEHIFAICRASDDKHVGNIKVGPVKANHSVADISLFIGEADCWGKGYATEAIGAISRFAIRRLGIQKLAATAYADNIGSIGAFLKVGYRQEGLRRKHYMLDGAPADLVELGLCADEMED